MQPPGTEELVAGRWTSSAGAGGVEAGALVREGRRAPWPVVDPALSSGGLVHIWSTSARYLAVNRGNSRTAQWPEQGFWRVCPGRPCGRDHLSRWRHGFESRWDDERRQVPPATLRTALTIPSYPVHRQRFPESARRTSSSEGSALDRRSAGVEVDVRGTRCHERLRAAGRLHNTHCLP
jgi:hypothetical protein